MKTLSGWPWYSAPLRLESERCIFARLTGFRHLAINYELSGVSLEFGSLWAYGRVRLAQC
jgi:hypothetical protein